MYDKKNEEAHESETSHKEKEHMSITHNPAMVGSGGYGYGFGGGNSIAELLVIAALFGRRGFGDHDGGDGGCANARFLALENGISQTQDMIANQNVLGAIKDSATNAAIRFDAVQGNINSLSTQSLLAGERTNGNIAEVKFQNALNFQALGKQLSDCLFYNA